MTRSFDTPKGAVMAKLIRNVAVNGVWYGPKYGDPPPEVAAKIGNPLVWDTPPQVSAAGAGVDGQAATAPVGSEPAPATALDGLDRDGLLEVADSEGIDVNRRLGAAKLADAITEARAAKAKASDG